MPIRPENKALYPPDWTAISRRIRERSGGQCECKGECRRHTGRCRALNRQPHPRTGSEVVLTVAHLNHQPQDCRPENLRAFCQACHLSYDADHHAATRARTRQAAATAGMDALFDLADGAATNDLGAPGMPGLPSAGR